jgi:hypothetical protein
MRSPNLRRAQLSSGATWASELTVTTRLGQIERPARR